jgi:hypothetical protein
MAQKLTVLALLGAVRCTEGHAREIAREHYSSVMLHTNAFGKQPTYATALPDGQPAAGIASKSVQYLIVESKRAKGNPSTLLN